MTLNLNIANFGTGTVNNAVETANATQSKTGVDAQGAQFRGLSITRGAASTEDIEAASINESALTRSDPLGNLVKTAFNLPPPPPPWETL